MANIKCPYCAGLIPSDAKKCQHCGEWVVKQSNPFGRGSTDARAVAKGIKQLELQKREKHGLRVLAVVVAVGVGLFGLGSLAAVVLIWAGLWIAIEAWYYRE